MYSHRYILIRTVVRAIVLPLIVALPVMGLIALDLLWAV